MRKYAEINKGFVVGFHEREDKRVPEFLGRSAVRVDTLPNEPAIGDEHFGGTSFGPPARPNPNLDPPPETNREVLDEIRGTVNEILALLAPGPP